ncbi:MAG: permease-like cell division protein FtsX [Candidatus Palauibacterales bacterium]|nr:permease-like cell division protein FtsX [Candidatus Palauibacterales bacterium]MDP2528684.1 permease-like cell division protein FtsX [Candidatus Palauibacterales bacterium]MDP2584245.1 permease-like cell division protein FtsX [Candidatus Palauibacterales bacterium]
MRALREAMASLRRAPLLGVLSMTSIGFSLFILGLFGLTAYNIDLALSHVEEQVQVVAYLRDGTGESRVDVARKEVVSFPEVSGVRYISKVEALHDASQELTEFSDVFSNLEVNPLPASLEVSLKPGYRNPDAVRRVAERLRSYDFVDDVRYGRDWVERIFSLRRIAGAASLILGGAFALVAVMLVGTAVRMAILARSEEIAIMQTIGATEGYIRRPYLLEGLMTGLAGGLLAFGLTWGTWRLVDASFLKVSWMPDVWIVAGIAGAALLGMLSAGRAVRKELRGLYDL